MPSTRSSAAAGSKDASPAPSAASGTAGTKRKASPASSPAAKRGRNAADAKQATIEESMADAPAPRAASPTASGALDAPEDASEEAPKVEAKEDPKEAPKEEPDESAANGTTPDEPANGNANGDAKDEPASSAPGITHDASRAAAIPSTVIERGLFYFFARPRVNVTDPSSVADLARSYLVLRPLAADAAPDAAGGAATQASQERFRVLAVPKKVLPANPSDRFMLFVDAARLSAEDVKRQVLKGSTYDTQSSGTRHAPAARPVGAGVYALVHAGATTHFAYVTTQPSEGGALQDDVHLREKGSFVLSLKNPTVKGPANAQLPQGAAFPEEILQEFGSRSWLPPARADVLDYANAQVLMIGEGAGELGKAGEGKGAGDGEVREPGEELERMGEEDEERVKHLDGRFMSDRWSVVRLMVTRRGRCGVRGPPPQRQGVFHDADAVGLMRHSRTGGGPSRLRDEGALAGRAGEQCTIELDGGAHG